MRKFLLFAIIFILKNSYALGYECNKEFTITNFNSKQKIYNRTVAGEYIGQDNYSYFVFDNNDMVVIRQSSCLITGYHISYYYNKIKDFDIMYKNYLTIINENVK